MKKLDINECKRLREEGKTYPEIALLFGVSKQAVFDALDKIGTPKKTKYSQYYKEWEELYRNGMGIHTIAEKYNCTRGAVHKHLRKKFVIERGKLRKEKAKYNKEKLASPPPSPVPAEVTA